MNVLVINLIEFTAKAVLNMIWGNFFWGICAMHNRRCADIVAFKIVPTAVQQVRKASCVAI